MTTIHLSHYAFIINQFELKFLLQAHMRGERTSHEGSSDRIRI